MRFLCAYPWNKSVIITALCRKTSIHRMVNYNQSLNYRLLGRAFHTIKSYLKHSVLRLKAVIFLSLLIQAFFCNRSWCPSRLCRLRTYFRSQIAISESSSVYCTSLLSSTVHKWFCHTVPSGLPCAQVHSRTILCFVTALLSACFNSHHLCEGLCISRLFLLTFFKPPRESGFWFIAENHKTEQHDRSIKNVSPIFHISPCPLP